MTIRGDKQCAGNRHFKLSSEERSCTFTMLQGGRVKRRLLVRRSITLQLPEMAGNAGEIFRQAAELAAARKINLTFRIDGHKLHVTPDPDDFPDHRERKQPVGGMLSRAVGLDLNPNWIGIAGVESTGYLARLDQTEALDWALVELMAKQGVSRESVTEMHAKVCARAIAIARKFGVATISVEHGLGKLLSMGPARDLNHTLNYWARNRLVAMLRRKPNLAGIAVIEVPPRRHCGAARPAPATRVPRPAGRDCRVQARTWINTIIRIAEILKDHVTHHVEHAMASGNKTEQRTKSRLNGRDRTSRTLDSGDDGFDAENCLGSAAASAYDFQSGRCGRATGGTG